MFTASVSLAVSSPSSTPLSYVSSANILIPVHCVHASMGGCVSLPFACKVTSAFDTWL